MSYDPRADAGIPAYPEPRSNYGGLFIGFLFGAGMLIAAGAYLFPVLHKQWNEADITEKVRLREAEARAEADLEFRKAEARMKAEAIAAGNKLEKLEIAPTAFNVVAQKAGPAVVNITNILFTERGEIPASEGSGVVYKVEKDSDGLPVGYIVTNSHVIHKPTSINRYDVTDRVDIKFSSGRTVSVLQGGIYHDPFYDLAVIRFDAADFEHLTVAEWGNSDQCTVGEWVVAIGSPFGLKQSVTSGIISAKGRSELRQQVETEVLQTDAAINMGNSGGPLLDLKGRVIGINVAIATQNGNMGSNGVGFSIPSNTAKLVIEELLVPPHEIKRGYLGVRTGMIDPKLATRVGTEGGALVVEVKSSSPAENAGLQLNDLIISIGARSKKNLIRNPDDLKKLIRGLKPEEKIDLEVLRGIAGRINNIEKLNLTVTLKQLPNIDLQQEPDQFGNPFRQQPRPRR